jgi:hypothetical protein
VGVEVLELLLVEEGGRARDVLEPELPDHALERLDLLPLARRPAEQREVVAHGLRQVALLAELEQRNLVAPLGELLALLVHEQRQVREHRILPVPERVAQQDVARRGG